MIRNLTGFPCQRYRKLCGDGKVHELVVVRATFALPRHGEVAEPAERQHPLQTGDRLIGKDPDCPMRAVVHRAGELIPPKPGADILIHGHAHSEQGRPRRDWLAGIRVGQCEHLLQVSGPRQFERRWGGWRLSEAQAVETVALDYRLAFGGCFLGHPAPELPPRYVYKADNPAGCGWLPDRRAFKGVERTVRRAIDAHIGQLRHLPAPRIHHPKRPIRTPYDRLPTEGFGPMARWCEPRIGYAGTFDERWRTQRHPLLPEDYDPRNEHCAHPSLIHATPLRGNEWLATVGLLPEGPLGFYLPGIRVVARGEHDDGTHTTQALSLDTLAVDLDTRTLGLTWRGCFEAGAPLREAKLLAVSQAPAADARPHGRAAS
ncbi:DUF2169 family type VI secretion system accessory protein [Arhodomonas sp. AD133]|uniref:DUF2169 family type VI secretion system accessory protein n=1 Tax=Arhodomonas sp. AD133 TaxID=3415009 RepID=UPI003EBE2E2D